MPTEKLAQMDVYGTMRVPFEIAAYCRGHKYSSEAVALARAIRKREEAHNALLASEAGYNAARDQLDEAIAATRIKMEASRTV